MSCFVGIFVMILMSAAQGQPATAPTSQPADGAFIRQLEAIDQRASAIADLTADFVQEKHSPLLRKPLVSRGAVRAKGGLALWKTTEPEPAEMSIDPQLLRMYYPKQRVIEEYPMQQQLGMMAASPLPRLSAIRESFSMSRDAQQPTDGGVAVRMEPQSAELKRYVDHVRVVLDEQRCVVTEFAMVDPDGEQTVIRFSNVRTNANLTDDQLKLDAPAGTKVVRPLEGAR